jgi:hypothetical protein
VPEVIPLTKSKACAAAPVNRVPLQTLTQGGAGQEVVVGADIGKFEILTVPRWGNGDFGRPWRVHNPEQISAVIRLLVPLAQGRHLGQQATKHGGTDGRESWLARTWADPRLAPHPG